MKNIRLSCLIISLLLSPLSWAATCAEYNAMGPNVESLDELYEHPISPAQIDTVREMTALKASRIAALQYTPMAKKCTSSDDVRLLGAKTKGDIVSVTPC